MSATGRTDGRTGRTAGFTLVEMLVVLAVMALVAGLAWPAAERGIAGAQFRADVQRAMGLLAATRAAAVAAHRPVAFEPGQSIEQARWSLPQGGLVFFADGSASGGEVSVRIGERQARFLVAGETGMIRRTD